MQFLPIQLNKVTLILKFEDSTTQIPKLAFWHDPQFTSSQIQQMIL